MVIERCEESLRDVGVTGSCRIEGRIFKYGRVGGKCSVSGEGEIKEVGEGIINGEKSKRSQRQV